MKKWGSRPLVHESLPVGSVFQGGFMESGNVFRFHPRSDPVKGPKNEPAARGQVFYLCADRRFDRFRRSQREHPIGRDPPPEGQVPPVPGFQASGFIPPPGDACARLQASTPSSIRSCIMGSAAPGQE